MGGKALGFPTDRISSYERNTILDQLSTPLLRIFETVDSPKPEPNKETHGDVDLVVSGPLLSSELQREMIAHIGLTDRVHNSYLYRVGDKNVQIDIEIVDPKLIQTMLFTTSYGDLGMLLGIACRSLNLSCSRYGLFYKHLNDKYLVTTEIEEICEILGLDFSAWNDGFKTKLEAFEWLLPIRPNMITERDTVMNREHHKRCKRLMHQEFIEWNTKRLYHDLFVKEQEKQWRETFRNNFPTTPVFMSRVMPSLTEHTQKLAYNKKMKTLLDADMIKTEVEHHFKRELNGPELGKIYTALRSTIDINVDQSKDVRNKLISILNP